MQGVLKGNQHIDLRFVLKSGMLENGLFDMSSISSLCPHPSCSLNLTLLLNLLIQDLDDFTIDFAVGEAGKVPFQGFSFVFQNCFFPFPTPNHKA